MTTLAWYRAEIARHEQQVEQWRATAAELQRENTDLRMQRDEARTALAHMHATCTEQQAEIQRMAHFERLAHRVDL